MGLTFKSDTFVKGWIWLACSTTTRGNSPKIPVQSLAGRKLWGTFINTERMIKNLDHKEELQLLSDNYIGHLAFIASGSPHVLPITYYYDSEHQRIISYASEGHKIKAMRKNKLVALAVDEINSVNKWRSILVHGEFKEVHGPDAKFELHQFTEGVKDVISRKEKKQLQFISEFSSKLESEGIPIVYHIQITEITSKFRES